MNKRTYQSNTSHRPKQNHNSTINGHNKGFSMVEVLVAIVVLSIGLLGLAGLQTAGLKANHSAYQRSQASIMANEILDRMRANYVGIQAGFYDDPYSGGTPSDPGCITSGCSVANMAQYDVFYWETSLNSALPNGQGAITGSGAGSVFTITVMWDDERTGATGTSCSGDSSVDLTCFIMSTRI